jgi:hypothetical protein
MSEVEELRESDSLRYSGDLDSWENLSLWRSDSARVYKSIEPWMTTGLSRVAEARQFLRYYRRTTSRRLRIIINCFDWSQGKLERFTCPPIQLLTVDSFSIGSVSIHIDHEPWNVLAALHILSREPKSQIPKNIITSVYKREFLYEIAQSPNFWHAIVLLFLDGNATEWKIFNNDSIWMEMKISNNI